MPKFPFSALDDFRRLLDQTFDEVLIGPWRLATSAQEPALIVEGEREYEVRICTGEYAPHELEVEVVGQSRLTVRGQSGGRRWERIVNLAEAIETEKVTARWANGILTVVLPKRDDPTRPSRF